MVAIWSYMTLIDSGDMMRVCDIEMSFTDVNSGSHTVHTNSSERCYIKLFAATYLPPT